MPVSCFYFRKVWPLLFHLWNREQRDCARVKFIYLLFLFKERFRCVFLSYLWHTYPGRQQAVLSSWVSSRVTVLSSAAASKQPLWGALVLCPGGALVPREGTHTFWMSDTIFLRARQLSRSIKSLFPQVQIKNSYHVNIKKKLVLSNQYLKTLFWFGGKFYVGWLVFWEVM